MEILSFMGVVLGIALFVLLCFKGFNLIFSSIISSIVVAVTAQLPILDTLNDSYMTTAAGFLKGYLLLFLLSALFGKMMEDSGAVRKIALSLVKLTKRSKNNQKFWAVMSLPIFYFILSYVGISGFVLVFTVVSIGRELFEECDIPWMYYCYGSAGIFPAIVLGGNLQATNIMATQAFGVTPTAAFLLSVILAVVSWVVLGIQIKLDVKKAAKKGEGFLPTGDAAKKLQLAAPVAEDQLPGLALSIIPLLIPILTIVILKMDVLVALSLATIVGFLLFFKKFKSIKTTMTTGIVSAAAPVITVAMCSGLVSVIKVAPAYALIGGWFDALPSFLPGVAVVFVMSAVVGSSSSALTAFMPYIVEKFTAAGISGGVAARLVTASCSTYMMPHCAGVVNAVSLTKLDFKKAAWVYFKSTCIPGFCAMVVGIVLVMAGVFG